MNDIQKEIDIEDKEIIKQLISEFYSEWQQSITERVNRQKAITLFESSHRFMSLDRSYNNRQLCVFAFRALVDSYGLDCVSVAKISIEKMRKIKKDRLGFLSLRR